jgi:Extracellular mutant protein 11
MPAGAYVDARDKSRTAFTNANLGADQAQRSTSQPRAANGGRADGLADRRRQAEGLRMPVPQMSLQRVPVTTANAGIAFAGLASKVAQLQRPRSAMVNTFIVFLAQWIVWLTTPKKQRPLRLDDTESLRSTTSGGISDAEDQREWPSADYDPYPKRNTRDVGDGQFSRIYPNDCGYDYLLGPQWREELEEEKRYQSRGLNQRESLDDQLEQEEDGGDFEQMEHDGNLDQQMLVRRPSKLLSTPPPAPSPQKTVINHQKPAVPIKQVSPPPIPVKHSTKSSSIVSSDEEVHPPQSNQSTKRPYDQVDSLDYDPSTLKTMTYDELEQAIYTTDPRAPILKVSVNAHGVPLILPGKLANMSRMPEDDIRAMFEAQTDTEREKTGEWFVGEMMEMMKRVARTRVERRKVALKLELEVKKRQKWAEKKTEEVEQELKGLKKGGSELIGRKASASPMPEGGGDGGDTS